MKIVKQHDIRDCGAACLAMIASHFGVNYPFQYYREITKTDRNGANLYGLVDAGKKLGLSAEALSGDLNELLDGISSGEIKLPIIAHTITEDNMQHFVVVASFSKDKFTILDPGKGKQRKPLDQFSHIWTGYIVSFEETPDTIKCRNNKDSFTKFFKLLSGQKKQIALILVLSLIIAAIGIAGSYVFEIVLDDFYSTSLSPNGGIPTATAPVTGTHQTGNRILDFISANASQFNVFFALIIGLYLLQGGIQFARGYLISVLSKKIDLRLMIPYYDKIIDLPINTINTRATGEYLARFSDASTIRNAVSGATLTIVLDSVMVIASAIILWQQNSKLFFVSLIMIALYAIVVLVYRKPIENVNRSVMEKNATVQSYLKESIDGIELLKANNAGYQAKEKNSSKFKSFIGSVLKLNILSSSQDAICTTVEFCGIVIILWMGFGMAINGIVGVGSIMTFYALLAYFTTPIKNLIELQPLIQTAVIAADRLNDILDAKSEDEDIAPEEQMQKREQSVPLEELFFSHVNFRYGNQELTLRDISFSIKRGEKIAIVGQSGSGKTTIAKLLIKFYLPENGTILYNNDDYAALPNAFIREKIAYVDQNTFLFSDTIANNLRLGKPSATDEEIEKLCIETQVDSFIKNLPFGLNTVLEENGQNLSGGQRQRLSIVRALLKKPEILILDEATSNLDITSESAIKKALFDTYQDLTCVIIAHRLSTIKTCDRIIVLDNGRIVETGTYNELVHQQNYFYRLFSIS